MKKELGEAIELLEERYKAEEETQGLVLILLVGDREGCRGILSGPATPLGIGLKELLLDLAEKEPHVAIAVALSVLEKFGLAKTKED